MRPIELREIDYIALLTQIPLTVALSTLAHELAHTYLHLEKFPPLSPMDEEGVCECFAHVILEAIADGRLSHGVRDEAKFILQNMAQRSDRVYGGGYKKALMVMRRVGGTLPQLLQSVRTNRAVK